MDPTFTVTEIGHAMGVLQPLARMGSNLAQGGSVEALRSVFRTVTSERLFWTRDEIERLTASTGKQSDDDLSRLIQESATRLRDLAVVAAGSNPKTVFGRVRKENEQLSTGDIVPKFVARNVDGMEGVLPKQPYDLPVVDVVCIAFLGRPARRSA